MRKMCAAILVVFFALSIVLPALAVTTAFWRLVTFTEFEKGQADHVAISSEGILALSPAYEQVRDISTTYVWCLAQDAALNLYAGTGDKGIIYKITGFQKAAEFCKLSEQHVNSLVVDNSGNLFAGTSPRGTIYKITPSGQATVFAQTKESYVWALAWARESKTLYAATGPRGRIFKISPSGEVQLVLDSGQNHILCLVVDKDDNLYAGSEPNGLVYKITPAGKTFVLYDAPEDDVHSLALDAKGNLYVATADAGELPAPPSGRPSGALMPEAVSVLQQLTSEKSTSQELPKMRTPPLLIPPMPETPSPAPPPPSVTAKNSIYKIAPDGRVTQILNLNRTMILSLAVIGNELWAGTGNEAKLYRVSISDPLSYEMVMDASELQILSLLPLAKDSPCGILAIATANQGHVYGLKTGFAKEGTYLSTVFDTGSISQWGAISWEGDVPSWTVVSASTRTGNSAKPDKTWSDWSSEIKESGKEKIKSPPARFIQLKVKFSSATADKSPRIREIKVPYLTFNMPPTISRLTMDGAATGTVEGEKSTTSSPTSPTSTTSEKITKTTTATTTKAAAPTPGAIPTHKVERVVSWEAKDPDGDKLTYKLYYKAVDEKEWKLLKDELATTTYTWDTDTVADGEYELRLIASDAPSNPPDRAQKAEKISAPVLIDNTKPVVESLSASRDGKKWKIRGKAHDALSVILEIQYSVDAKEWVSIYPITGIFDSKTAEFEFILENLEPGEHTVAVKATDAAGNRGVGKVLIR